MRSIYPRSIHLVAEDRFLCERKGRRFKVYKANSPTGAYTLIGSTAQLQITDPGSDKGFYYIKAATDTITK